MGKSGSIRGGRAACQPASGSAIRWMRDFADRLWPPDCQACGGVGLGPEICRGCFRDLPRATIACARCAAPLPATGHCGACLARPPGFQRAVVPFLYMFPIDRLLQRLKFHGRLEHARLLGELLGHHVRRRSNQVNLIVPVPLHRKRLMERGFNQAQELAHWVSRRSALTLRSDLCCRISDTPPLWPLSPRNRARELRDAFECRGDIAGARLAIVDDILTTGATASALARVLFDAGAKRVEIWAVARAVRPPPMAGQAATR